MKYFFDSLRLLFPSVYDFHRLSIAFSNLSESFYRFLRFFQESAREIIDCFKGQRNKTNDNRQYSENVRKFALQLHVISPKGYSFVREQFGNTLPHPSTLRKWYDKSDCNGKAGLMTESMKTLKCMAEIKKIDNKPLLVSLSFDEVSIRKHIQWIHDLKVWSGYISYGKLVNGELPVANNVLMFMATCLETGTSLPIAYYFITTLNADEKKFLVLTVLAKLYEIGVTVTNLSFDGFKPNITMCEMLGVSFDVENIIPYFIDPASNNKVYVLLDPCHMIKLLRNALGDVGYIRDPSRGKIEWAYFVRLENLRVKRKYVTHKLNKKHIQYFRNKMNVKLATQTLSTSVASSMVYLSTRLKTFESCSATVFFIETINRLFDTMNSKKVHKSTALYFKNPITETNAETIFLFYDIAVNYLKSLQFKRVKCIHSRRKTGFVGFIINTYTIKELYNEYVRPNFLPSIRVLYHSQDVLESYFSRIRYLGQNNDNPTAQQFQSAVRKLIFSTEIRSSEFANCDDNLNLLKVSSTPRNKTINMHEMIESTDEMFDEEQYIDISTETVETEEEITIAFKAGEIEKKIESGRFECDMCVKVLNEDYKISGNFVENTLTQRPCISTYVICKITNEHFEACAKSNDFYYYSMLNSIRKSIPYNAIFEHSDFTHEPSHKNYFINFIIDEYVRMYGTYAAKNITLELQQKMLRNKNRRVYIFAGQ